MSYSNAIMVELMVPRGPEVNERLQGFYGDIGWSARNDTDSKFFTYVHPEVGQGMAPVIGYWQTENMGKIALFQENEIAIPSSYARGLRLPNLQELVEVCLVLPSDEDVHNIYEQGGKLLESHTHTPPRDHAGSQEFRFGDPFGYSFRVTANPGWEIEIPRSN